MSRRRLAGLDLLRLAAVLLVMGRHLPASPSEAPAWLRPLIEPWQRGGWVGVDLFFVLSGFLVSGLLFSEIQTGKKFQMQTMDIALLELYQKGEITYDTAISNARDPETIRRRTG